VEIAVPPFSPSPPISPLTDIDDPQTLAWLDEVRKRSAEMGGWAEKPEALEPRAGPK
jgi:hypothetical protein